MKEEREGLWLNKLVEDIMSQNETFKIFWNYIYTNPLQKLTLSKK